MTAITEDWTLVDGLAADPSILAALDREAICVAILDAHDTSPTGTVTAATIRARLERPVNPNRVGGVISALVNHGVLKRIRRTAKSGNRAQRNGQRDMPVYRIPDLERVR